MSQVLGDRYEINRQLSRKAGRQTLLALDHETGEQVVIKLLTFSSEFDWEALRLFEREIQTLKTLSHPTIPKYLNSFELNEKDSQGFALVQTYIEAPSLESYIKAGRTFSEIEIKQVAESLLETLIYLHGQLPPVIHRDIKPSNVLLADRSGNYVGQVYLVDFGSVQMGTSKNSSTFTVVGTYGYMPPEQFSGRTTPVSDLYSLGATLIYLVTGQHPADLITDDLQLEFVQPPMLSPELTRWLRQIVQSAPSKRFANAKEALQVLKNPYPYEDLAFPVVRPVGCRITLNKEHNQLCIQLPYAYLVSPNQLNQFLGMSTGVVGLVIFVMIFTASPWHIISFLVFIYLCDAVSKICSYKILIDDEKISFQALLMSFKLKTWSYRKEDIHRLDFGRLFLKGWAQTIIPVEQLNYQFILNIGEKSYVIYTNNEIEISWLAHELSKWLNLPLTLLTANEAPEKTTTSQHISQPRQILQSSTQQTIDRVSPPVAKPANSKIQLTKQNGELRIHLPPQTSGMIVAVQVFIAILSCGAYFLLPFLSWVCFWCFGWMEGAELREVVINPSCIRFRYKLYGLTIVRSYPRQQISRLHVVDAYQSTAFDGSTIQHPNQIVVWLGALSIPIKIPTDVEMIWLSQELSEWLNRSITPCPLVKS